MLVPGFFGFCSAPLDLLCTLSDWAYHASLQSLSRQTTYIQQARLGGVAWSLISSVSGGQDARAVAELFPQQPSLCARRASSSRESMAPIMRGRSHVACLLLSFIPCELRASLASRVWALPALYPLCFSEYSVAICCQKDLYS